MRERKGKGVPEEGNKKIEEKGKEKKGPKDVSGIECMVGLAYEMEWARSCEYVSSRSFIFLSHMHFILKNFKISHLIKFYILFNHKKSNFYF